MITEIHLHGYPTAKYDDNFTATIRFKDVLNDNATEKRKVRIKCDSWEDLLNEVNDYTEGELHDR